MPKPVVGTLWIAQARLGRQTWCAPTPAAQAMAPWGGRASTTTTTLNKKRKRHKAIACKSIRDPAHGKAAGGYAAGAGVEWWPSSKTHCLGALEEVGKKNVAHHEPHKTTF